LVHILSPAPAWGGMHQNCDRCAVALRFRH
jgi:hypothetical protein